LIVHVATVSHIVFAAMKAASVVLVVSVLLSAAPLAPGNFLGLFDSGHDSKSVTSPLVTVITVTRNPNLELLKDTRESIRAQTLTRWVWLIMDDGSSAPNARDGMEHLSHAGGSITVIHAPPQGLCSSRRAALDLVETPYVMYLDTGAKLETTALEKDVRFLETNQQFPAAGFQHRFAEGRANLLFNVSTTPSVVRTAMMHVAASFVECSNSLSTAPAASGPSVASTMQSSLATLARRLNQSATPAPTPSAVETTVAIDQTTVEAGQDEQTTTEIDQATEGIGTQLNGSPSSSSLRFIVLLFSAGSGLHFAFSPH